VLFFGWDIGEGFDMKNYEAQELQAKVSKEKDAEIERSNDVRYRWDAGKSKIAELEKEIERLDSGWKLANQLRLEDNLTIEQLNAKVWMLRKALNECLEDSREVLDDYLQKHGENFKSHRIEAQKKIIADAVQAVSATEQDVTRWVNGVKADALDEVATMFRPKHKNDFILSWTAQEMLQSRAKQLRGEQVRHG
jgi:hypothetical protein